MRKLCLKFLTSKEASLVPAFALSALPLLAVLGISVDYTSGVNSKNEMQNALDAATLAITTLPIDTTLLKRQEALQAFYTANKGDGTATLISFTVDADGTAHAKSAASYSMPTDFLRLATITNVSIHTTSAVTKTPALIKATFKVDKASGWWDKKMTLFGIPFESKTTQELMRITYTYNKGGDSKGYGTTTVSVPNVNGVYQDVQTQTCVTKNKSDYSRKNPIPADAIVNGEKVTTCSIALDTTGGKGAAVDVTKMDVLYLQMDVPSGSPKVLKSNDPATSNRLYIDGVEVATGKTIDIFRVVPCGQSSSQAWEDGGNAVPAPVSNADFFYTVTGQCAFSQRPSETVLTQ